LILVSVSFKDKKGHTINFLSCGKYGNIISKAHQRKHWQTALCLV
jgi:hypothetical protein